MSSVEVVKSWIAETLKSAGYRGRGRVWRLAFPETHWAVGFQKLPYGERLGVDVGLEFDADVVPRRVADYSIVLALEYFPMAGDFAVVEALDLRSGMGDQRRRQEIEGAIRAAATYIASHQSVDEMRAAYRAGDFDSAFIDKDARAFLEADGP